ncbi:zinc finger, CCHC-type containing protein [Tanacetum coccineum]
MRDMNPIITLGDYSKPSHKGYKNTIELPVGNNVVPLRSDTLRLVQNGCSFHRHQSEDPNQHLKDFLKLMDSLDLDASNWLECLPTRSITTWKDLTTRFLAQFFPPKRTAKLRNDILMFQQHHGESLSEAWTLFKDLLQKVPHHGIDFGSKSKVFMTMSISSQDEPSINWPLICSGPHDTQYCMENPEQAFVEYTSSRTDEAGGLVSNFMASQDARLSKFEADFKQQQSEMTNKIDIVLKAITYRMAGALPSDTVKNPKQNVHSTSLILSARSYPTIDPQCLSHPSTSIMLSKHAPRRQAIPKKANCKQG